MLYCQFAKDDASFISDDEYDTKLAENLILQAKDRMDEGLVAFSERLAVCVEWREFCQAREILERANSETISELAKVPFETRDVPVLSVATFAQIMGSQTNESAITITPFANCPKIQLLSSTQFGILLKSARKQKKKKRLTGALAILLEEDLRREKEKKEKSRELTRLSDSIRTVVQPYLFFPEERSPDNILSLRINVKGDLVDSDTIAKTVNVQSTQNTWQPAISF